GAIAITDELTQKELTGQDTAATLAALNRDVATDKEASSALAKAWNGRELMTQMQPGALLVQSALPNVARAIGDYADTRTRPVEEARTYREIKERQANGEAGKTERAWLERMERNGYSVEQANAVLSDPSALQEHK